MPLDLAFVPSQHNILLESEHFEEWQEVRLRRRMRRFVDELGVAAKTQMVADDALEA